MVTFYCEAPVLYFAMDGVILAMPPREYTPINMMIALHPTDSAAYVSRKMGRGVIDK